MRVWVVGLIVFAFAFAFRIWNLNTMGRWWDEGWYATKGYTFIELAKKGDFTNPFWYVDGADHPPLSSYFYGLASYRDLIKFNPYAKPFLSSMPKGNPVFQYDLTYTRLVSVIISSLAVVLVFLIGVRYFSLFVGITAAMILAMLPHFLGFSQLVTLESWIMFFFTACVFTYILFLEKNQNRFLILTGILTGLSLEVKQSNIIIFAFYMGAFYFWRKLTKRKDISYYHLIFILFISLVTFVVIFPIPFLHLQEFIKFNYDLWFKNSGRVPELLFGRHMGSRWFFYIIAFLVTTPLVILILGFIGMKASWNNKKKWIYLVIITWFFTPFLMSFFHMRQNMVRYIIEFYAPLSILVAIGFEYVLNLFSKSKKIKYFAIIPLFIYLMIILINITPYYLNYFNELVGGTKNVYQQKLFFLGWFGEGLRGSGIYIANYAKKNSIIGMALDPEQTLYKSPKLRYKTFNPKDKYDYVIVNYFDIVRIGFNEELLNKDYKLVYAEKADGADLAYVYKHR